MSRYSGLEHCKTDLIATKGIVFAKFSKASAALTALEKINETRMVSLICINAGISYKKNYA